MSALMRWIHQSRKRKIQWKLQWQPYYIEEENGKKEKAKEKNIAPFCYDRVHVSWVCGAGGADSLRVCWLICWFLGSANQKFKGRMGWGGEGNALCKCKCNEIKCNKANKNRQPGCRSSDWLTRPIPYNPRKHPRICSRSTTTWVREQLCSKIHSRRCPKPARCQVILMMLLMI